MSVPAPPQLRVPGNGARSILCSSGGFDRRRRTDDWEDGPIVGARAPSDVADGTGRVSRPAQRKPTSKRTMDIGAVRQGQKLTKILPDVKLILNKSIFFVARRLRRRPIFCAVDTKAGAS